VNKQFKNQPAFRTTLTFLAGLALLLVMAAAFSAQPAQASPPLQDDYPVETPTTPVQATATTAPGQATATTVPTAGVTPIVTLPPPAVTGTPTQLVPVTGADLPGPGSMTIGVWVALWLMGLMLIAYGLRAKLGKR
jgi:hypothetical protein